MAEEIDGAMQQAPQSGRHVKASGGVEFTIALSVMAFGHMNGLNNLKI